MSREQRPLAVTRTYLPPVEEFLGHARRVWETNQLTNNGALVRQLEERFRDLLGVRHVILVANGTLALQIAVRGLGLEGEVVTSPFSYVASTSSLVWERCDPVFVDVDPDTLCMDPDLVERAITPRTSAILPVHVYGHPCDVVRIGEIAARHGLPVVYDAAHAFGVTYRGRPLAAHGDVSTLSFHATKLFHTAEGGALCLDDDDLAAALEPMRRFGHDGPEAFSGLGTNAKMSELHAAMGLAVLPRVGELIARQRGATRQYDAELEPLVASGRIRRPRLPDGAEYNFSYYPVIFGSEDELLRVRATLNADGVFPRRYFCPSLNTLPYVRRQEAPVAESVAARVLCLPLSHDLTPDDVARVAAGVRRALAIP